MLAENKFTRYLIYAIGEIVLVVIGILIALNINNWNEATKSRSKELKYLRNLEAELVNDSVNLERTWFRNRTRKIESLELAKEYILGDFIPVDTLGFINEVGFGGVNSRASFEGSSRTYQEMISTGNLSLILDDSIRTHIVDYYNNKDFIRNYSENIRSDYATYFNSLKAYNPQFPEMVYEREIPRILEGIKSDEFHGLINQELTYAYSIERTLNRNKKNANMLHLEIAQFLKNQ